ncbi:MAG: hypothetical protein LBV72_12075 [Tannerella sp.]|jgi:hypothetical protein|nr:hypothetical protein [Tannerella sp.]
MRNKVLIFLTLIVTISSQLYAQELFESLGGVKTKFKIYSNMVDLEVKTQFIIKDAEKSYGSYQDGTYGYGYESYHLEFVTNRKLATITQNRSSVFTLQFTFYDSNDKILAEETSFRSDNRISDTGKDGLWFYSIDLIDIPISLLNHTAKIDIVLLEYKK